MSIIKVLDNSTIEKIAAGEIIERPASIVKELVENSIDSGADDIVIEIKNGGKDYIRVTDNGIGISEEDIPIAFKRHSTSKLKTIDDLYNIQSLGFRGEALASISNVSKVEVLTKKEEELIGIQSTVAEGQVGKINSVGCPNGTTMIIEELFYNLPVRKKFLKSELIETNHVSDIIYKIALGNPNISFKYIKDNKVVLKTSKANDLDAHIYSVLGKEFVNNLLEIKHIDDSFKIRGMISNNQLYRSNRSHQYVYVNGRYIENKDIATTIEMYYKSMIPINRFPVFILFIDIDPSLIDVNIHPTKQEIKFANNKEFMDELGKEVKNILYPSISIPKIKEKIIEPKAEAPIIYDFFTQDEKKKLVEDSKQIDKAGKTSVKDGISLSNFKKLENEVNNLVKEVTPEEYETDESYKEVFQDLQIIGTVFNTYVICENKVLNKVYVIDQHAAHERIMYERYLKEFKEEKIVTQTLMLAETISLTDLEMNNFMDNLQVFEDLGFIIEVFGQSNVIVRGVPMIFGKPNVKKIFFDVLDNIGTNIQSKYDFNLEKIMKIACVNSVKGGDNLDNIEIESLIERLSKCVHPHTCPHGRPTIIEISRTEIEKMFLRII